MKKKAERKRKNLIKINTDEKQNRLRYKNTKSQRHQIAIIVFFVYVLFVLVVTVLCKQHKLLLLYPSIVLLPPRTYVKF